MEEMLKDKRFAHIARDPKFRRIPKNVRKVKIDKRFQSMFTDKKFTIKYTVDKRGRSINQSSTENLRNFYDLSSSEEYSLSGESDFTEQDTQSEKKKSKKKREKPKNKGNAVKIKNSGETEKIQIEENETDESHDANFSSNGCLLLIKKHESTDSVSNSISDEDSNEEENEFNEVTENKKKQNVIKKSEKKLDDNIREKLRDLAVDYARGEGVLFSDSSSDSESLKYVDDEEEIEHNWGELDKEAETTDEITHRLAACNMDWDRIRAVDLLVLFNSFLPTGGLIHSVAIYPSNFGYKRMREEEIKGPIELVKLKNQNSDEDVATNEGNEEGSSYHMEKLRQYQLNRLKYYYAVIDFDSAITANRIYTECDGLEYESSSTKLDLRFIPDNMTFDYEPSEVCDNLPDLTKYKPRLFLTSALQQVKVDLTWDETNPERQEITQKLNSGNLDDLDKNDLQAYLASGSSEDESKDEVKKQLERVNDSNEIRNSIDKYKSLLKSIEQSEEEEKNKKIELEFKWGVRVMEKSEKLVKEKMKKTVNLTPFEQYLEKRKAKKIIKRRHKKNLVRNNEQNETDSEDSVPSDVDMNDPYFAKKLNEPKPKSKEWKQSLENGDMGSADKEEEKKRHAELELLLTEESNKHHFDMKRVEESECVMKSKKKRIGKNKNILKEKASQDDFEVNVQDPRFNALFTSHHYNIDSFDSHYRKTKGTDALINEKLKRRKNIHTDTNTLEEQATEENSSLNSKVNAETNSIINSIKRNTQNLNKTIAKKNCK